MLYAERVDKTVRSYQLVFVIFTLKKQTVILLCVYEVSLFALNIIYKLEHRNIYQIREWYRRNFSYFAH